MKHLMCTAVKYRPFQVPPGANASPPPPRFVTISHSCILEWCVAKIRQRLVIGLHADKNETSASESNYKYLFENVSEIADKDRTESLNEPFDLHELRRALREIKKTFCSWCRQNIVRNVTKTSEMFHKNGLKAV